MSVDLIEIALDRFTDWSKFEKIASEIVRDEGYPDVRPLGGAHDFGQDATVERFFHCEGQRLRVVFQFTLRSDVAVKIRETLKRLTEGGISFHKLVIVTSAQVSTETQQAIRKQVLREYSVDLDILERKTLVNRLADQANGIFHRYFPDIQRQVTTLLQPRAAALEAREEREEEFLKVCFAFTFAPDAQRTRKTLFDETVFGVLALRGGGPVTPAEIVAGAKEALGSDMLGNADQITASLQRLVKRGLVQVIGGQFSLSVGGRVRGEAARVSVEAAQRSVVADIVLEVCTAAGEAIADNVRLQLEENARELLTGYFRMNGLELADAFLSEQKPKAIYLQGTPRLVGVAKHKVAPYLGNLLVAAVGRALCTPSEDQAKYFACCSRSYIALQVMNLDPSLREFQAARFSRKTFVLDTDFVLEAIIRELPGSTIYRELASRLMGLGARVLVPEEVLVEVAKHLEISPSTYDYFGGGLAALSEELAGTRVWNALVLGYWYRAKTQGWAGKPDFLEYRENYFEADNPVGFVADVVQESLPGVEIGEIGTALAVSVRPGDVEEAASVLMQIVTGTPKGMGRTEEQNRQLAKYDAQLMIAVSRHNEARGTAKAGILAKTAYIVTSSGRYVRAAEKLKSGAQLSTRPHILMALLETVGPSRVDDRQFVRLFENSLLQQAVDSCWGSVKVLLDAGLELKDKNITRLRYDVEKRLDTLIADLREADTLAAESEEPPSDAGDKEHIALLDAAEKLGYRTTRLLAKVREEGQLKERELAKLATENVELREAVKRFGRKKERWLRRLDQQGKK